MDHIHFSSGLIPMISWTSNELFESTICHICCLSPTSKFMPESQRDYWEMPRRHYLKTVWHLFLLFLLKFLQNLMLPHSKVRQNNNISDVPERESYRRSNYIFFFYRSLLRYSHGNINWWMDKSSTRIIANHEWPYLYLWIPILLFFPNDFQSP